MIGFKEVVEATVKRFADSPLGKMSEGKSFDKPMSEYDKPLGLYANDIRSEKADDNGKVYTDENGKLLPNTEYTLNGNVYKTDDNGRIISCESVPKKTPENTRDTDAQTTVGGDDRKPGDQGGHIVGRDMGGDGGLGNLTPMDSRINQSDYKRMENDIKRAMEEGKDVSTKTEIEYDGDSDRPSKITTTVTIDGKDTVYTFDNDLDGSLMDKLKETCSESDLETAQDVLDETGGEISSTKEEYDANGNLEKTTVTITYTGDDGKNYRRQVVIDNTGGASV
ncbi:MAG: DNA/RNA non-specific endonuclease [Defluviitaleaceae bacterium]|nr:DNA/RNA non-specific endonuclease [Defluviitaleaceae bacterium]